jgi:SAM-dependent methyltransferase
MSDGTPYLSFDVDYHDPEVVAVYDELPLWSALFGLLLLRIVPLGAGMQVLDVGCGTGFPALELAQRLGPGAKVWGIDRWESAVARARLKARRWDVTNVDLRVGDAANLPFPDGQFDLVVSNLGINNFAAPDAVMSECRRVAKPSAKLALTTNLVGHMREFYDVFDSTLLSLDLHAAAGALQRHVAGRATVDAITALFARHGWRRSKVVAETATLRFADGSALLRHYFVKLAFLDGWKSVLEAADQEAVFTRLEANLNDLARSRGELALTIPMAYCEAGA